MPVDQLLKSSRKFPKIIIYVLIILIVVGAGGWGIHLLVLNNQNNLVVDTTVSRIPIEYQMEGNSMEKRMYRNDSVLVSINNETYKLELYNLGEVVTIRSPDGVRNLDLGQETTLDLNNDGIPEFRIMLADFARNNPEMGALLHFILLDTEVFTGADIEPIPAVVINTVPRVATIIPPSVSAYPFTLQVNFQGYCMFRWEILFENDRRGTNQRYFQRAEQLDIQAQNGIRIWMSNAQAARFQVIAGGRTFPVELGGAGEVVVSEIRWVRDDDSRLRLVVTRLET
jgi:hypothetical protein